MYYTVTDKIIYGNFVLEMSKCGGCFTPDNMKRFRNDFLYYIKDFDYYLDSDSVEDPKDFLEWRTFSGDPILLNRHYRIGLRQEFVDLFQKAFIRYLKTGSCKDPNRDMSSFAKIQRIAKDYEHQIDIEKNDEHKKILRIKYSTVREILAELEH